MQKLHTTNNNKTKGRPFVGGHLFRKADKIINIYTAAATYTCDEIPKFIQSTDTIFMTTFTWI